MLTLTQKTKTKIQIFVKDITIHNSERLQRNCKKKFSGLLSIFKHMKNNGLQKWKCFLVIIAGLCSFLIHHQNQHQD